MNTPKPLFDRIRAERLSRMAHALPLPKIRMSERTRKALLDEIDFVQIKRQLKPCPCCGLEYPADPDIGMILGMQIEIIDELTFV